MELLRKPGGSDGLLYYNSILKEAKTTNFSYIHNPFLRIVLNSIECKFFNLLILIGSTALIIYQGI